MPEISVIIPAYNGEKYLAETIESVLSQTFKDFEVIVVDDGSTDRTREIAQSYGNELFYVFKENGGPGSARNAGIKVSKGRFIALLDHDDLWLPEKLEKQISLIKKRLNVGMVFSDACLFNSKRGYLGTCFQEARPFSGSVFEKLFLRNFVPNLTTLTRKEIVTQLKRLGINTLTELESFLREYNEYCNDCNGPLSSNNS